MTVAYIYDLNGNRLTAAGGVRAADDGFSRRGAASGIAAAVAGDPDEAAVALDDGKLVLGAETR